MTVKGVEFALDDFLAETKLANLQSWHKGEQTPKGTTLEDSGVSVAVSESDLCDLKAQIQDATAFLLTNRSDLTILAKYTGVDEAYLSFAISMTSQIASFTFFPSEFITLAGEIGLGINLCQFRLSDPS